MMTRAVWLVMAAGLATGSSAWAQFVPPVKDEPKRERPAPPPQVEAVPIPAPPAPRDPNEIAEPPHVELKLVDITPKDEKGRVLPPPKPVEFMAIEAVMPQLSPEIQEGIKKAIISRQSGADRAIARKATTALRVREILRTLDDAKTRETILPIDQQVRELIISPSLFNHLQNNVLITRRQLADLSVMTSAYLRAFQTSVNRDDALVLKHIVRINAAEPMQVLDRLLLSLAGRWNEVKPKLALNEEQSKALAEPEAALSKAADDAAKREASAALLMALPEKSRTAALMAVATPLPRRPEPTPATPATPGK